MSCRDLRAFIALLALAGSLSVAGPGAAQSTVFFEENFNGPLDASAWRTEIVSSGPRWCTSSPGSWGGVGYWIDEELPCYGVAAYSPYGIVSFSGGMLYFSSHNGAACFYLVSRLPGSIQLFPSTGDFTLRMRLRYTHVTSWGTFVVVVQTPSTEPSGTNPVAVPEGVLMMIGASDGSWDISSALEGSFEQVALVPSTVYELHEFALDCLGTSFTIRLDGQVVYGPVSSALRPTAVWMGNPARSNNDLSDWEWFSVDYLRVEVPTPPMGACCEASGVCVQSTQAECQIGGGYYVGRRWRPALSDA